MSMTMHVDIVSLEAKIFAGLANIVYATGKVGEMGIYPGHAPLISSLKPGYIRVVLPEKKEQLFYVSGGLIEVQSFTISILADTVVRADDIDEAKAKAAQEKAEKRLKEKLSDIEYSEVMANLAQAAAQLQTLQKLRKKYNI
ncbi:MAG: F0F1 ATP synthase subunit epsilon [Pseudomonadota bacterium]